MAEVDVTGALKGGTGKTKLAMMKALYLASRGEEVEVIDGDTISQTAHKWARRAKAEGRPLPFVVHRHPFDDIDEKIDELSEGRPEVRIVVDVGGGNLEVFKSALRRANRLYVPIGADPSETDQLPATWSAAGDAVGGSTVGGFEGWVVLSKTDHSTSLPAQARRDLTLGEGGAAVYPVCRTEMRKRVGYQRAYGTVPREFYDIPDLLRETGAVKSLRKGSR
ncbi:ParA family protein [Streptomyces sp. NPDC059604]|uniref:ParA family protein n=1 Tax=Streptomyces sp. NPDC059604 TaxID=3346881 RepID=UPI0036760F55